MTDVTAAAPLESPRRRGFYLDLLVRLFREKPLGAFGGTIFVAFLFCSIFADVLAPEGQNQPHLEHRLEAPSPQFPMGTDHLGRDVFSRVLIAGRLSMMIGILGAGLATVISIVLGVLSGYFGGMLDLILQRMVDAWMTFPPFILLLIFVNIVGPGVLSIAVILALGFGIAGSRIIRGSVISVREDMYVHAAQSSGAGTFHVLRRHILPNIMPVVIVLFTIRIGAVILSEAGLAFLGLGVPPPQPTWGGMLSSTGLTYMYLNHWLVVFPGLCLFIVVYAVNVFGDALRDLLDPRMRGT